METNLKIETNFSIAFFSTHTHTHTHTKNSIAILIAKKKFLKEKGKKELIKRERETKEIFNEERDNVETK